MSEHPFMQVYVADYTADVQHLTCEQDGAYWRILRAMWRSGGSLPHDAAKLARICGLTLARWRKISPDVMDLLTVENGVVTQKRLAKEVQNAAQKSQKRSECGKLGGIAKSLKYNKTGLAKATVLPCHSPEPEPERKIYEEDSARGPIDVGRMLDRLREAGGKMMADPARSPAVANVGEILRLIHPTSGEPCDFELDVLPAISARAASASPGSVRSWAYFTNSILENRDRRLKPLPAPQETPTHGKSDPALDPRSPAGKAAARRANYERAYAAGLRVGERFGY